MYENEKLGMRMNQQQDIIFSRTDVCHPWSRVCCLCWYEEKKPDIDRPGTKSSLCLSVLYPRVWLFLPLGSQQEFLKLANHISNSETEKRSKKCPFRPQLFKAPRCTVINKIFFDFSSFTFVQCAHGLSQADGLERICIFLLHSPYWFLGREIPAEFCIKETFCWVLWVQIQSGHADHHILLTVYTQCILLLG